MTGTFSSLNIALSALRYNRTAMDVAGNNTANANTVGYTRRSVTAQSVGAPAVPALWSRYDGVGEGVEASATSRMIDPVLDARSRTEHASSSFLDTRSTALTRVETAIGEPGTGGIAAALTAFKNTWDTAGNTPGSGSLVLSKAETLRTTIATQASAVSTEWSDQRVRLTSLGAETNQAAASLADLNKTLQAANLTGIDANDLLDQRDQLTQKLSELTGASVTVNADTTVSVQVGGQALVSGGTSYAVSVSGASTMADAATDPPVFSVDGTAVTLTSGEVGATQQLLGTDLPDYQAKLDSFVSSMASAVNAQHALGVDLDGAAGGDFFSGTTAATLQVAITDPRKIAVADAAKGGLDGTNAHTMATLDLGEKEYRNLVTTFGTVISGANAATTTQAAVVSQIDAARESVSGVNTDEEMVNLLTAQRGYEGAAKLLTVMDSIMDTLINRTGVN